MTYPPLAVLGGLGAAWLARFSTQFAPRIGARLTKTGAVQALVATLLLFQFLWYAPVVRATTEEPGLPEQM